MVPKRKRFLQTDRGPRTCFILEMHELRSLSPRTERNRGVVPFHVATDQLLEGTEWYLLGWKWLGLQSTECSSTLTDCGDNFATKRL